MKQNYGKPETEKGEILKRISRGSTLGI